jgi:hypothetical protein
LSCDFTEDKLQKFIASSGNRTRAARVAGEHPTTEPTMLLYKNVFLFFRFIDDNKVVTGNETHKGHSFSAGPIKV